MPELKDTQRRFQAFRATGGHAEGDLHHFGDQPIESQRRLPADIRSPLHAVGDQEGVRFYLLIGWGDAYSPRRSWYTRPLFVQRVSCRRTTSGLTFPASSRAVSKTGSSPTNSSKRSNSIAVY